MSQFRPGDFAMQMIDKAKEKAGFNHGRSRLTDDIESQAARLPLLILGPVLTYLYTYLYKKAPGTS